MFNRVTVLFRFAKENAVAWNLSTLCTWPQAFAMSLAMPMWARDMTATAKLVAEEAVPVGRELAISAYEATLVFLSSS